MDVPPSQSIYLGCPLWAERRWVGSFYRSGTRLSDYLEEYASVFNTVEGNSTFYALPTRDTLRSWMGQTPEDFRFCFKVPRVISHESRLRDFDAPLKEFLHRIEPMTGKLGSVFLQLPAAFGPGESHHLASFLAAWPADLPLGVEPRHPGFFDGGVQEAAFDALLSSRRANRVLFDTTGLFQAGSQLVGGSPPAAPLQRALAKKPRVPLRTTVTGDRPMVRFVGFPEPSDNRAALTAWSERLLAWRAEGRTPFFFTHSPDDALCPEVGRVFAECCDALDDSLALNRPWPSEIEHADEPKQLALF